MNKLKFLTLTLIGISSTLCSAYQQNKTDLINAEYWAVAYSGFREGQHPDRGNGAVNPSDAEILEDLKILIDHGFSLIRMYDAGENTERTLELIRTNKLPMKVLLGIWLDAEFSNHEGCAWLTEPIAEEKLKANKLKNELEVENAIQLANEYKSEVVAINVGNEALVSWNDHMMPVERVIELVQKVKAETEQLVTIAENYEWWINSGKKLASELDFIGVHTYPVWEGKSIDEGMSYTLENIERVHDALPDSKIAILEAGWATTASEFGMRASEAIQKRYYHDLKAWANQTNTTVFFFEAFDEPWKGNPNNHLGAEKHWGLFFVDRSPKKAMK